MNNQTHQNNQILLRFHWLGCCASLVAFSFLANIYCHASVTNRVSEIMVDIGDFEPGNFKLGKLNDFIHHLKNVTATRIYLEDAVDQGCQPKTLIFRNITVSVPDLKSHLSKKVVSVDVLLDTLARLHPQMQWRCDDGCVAVSASKLANYRENPLDVVFGKISFSGTSQEFLDFLTRKYAEKFHDHLLAGGGYVNRPDTKIYKFETTGPASIRHILNRFAAENNLVWNAEHCTLAKKSWCGHVTIFIGWQRSGAGVPDIALKCE